MGLEEVQVRKPKLQRGVAVEVEQFLLHLPYCRLQVAAKENPPNSNTRMARQTKAQIGPQALIHAHTRFSTVTISIPTRLVHAAWTAVTNLMPFGPLCHKERRADTKLRAAFMPAPHLSGTVPTQVHQTEHRLKVKMEQRVTALFRETVRELLAYVISNTETGLALGDRVRSWRLAMVHMKRERWKWRQHRKDTAGIRLTLIPPGDTRGLGRMKTLRVLAHVLLKGNLLRPHGTPLWAPKDLKAMP